MRVTRVFEDSYMLIDVANSEVSLTNRAALAEWNGVILGVLDRKSVV